MIINAIRIVKNRNLLLFLIYGYHKCIKKERADINHHAYPPLSSIMSPIFELFLKICMLLQCL